METKELTINLADYQTPGAKVFTGRPHGEEVRSKSKLDELETSTDKFIVIIPETISSINPSFLEELFKNVVKRLGKFNFMNKFYFVNNGRYKIETDLREAIDRILAEENALS